MKFLTLEQFTEMWKLQDQLNSKTTGANWTEKKHDWNLAIKDEIMEFFTYVGWAWWKSVDTRRSPTDKQARLELVDIWCFLLSRIIEVFEEQELSIGVAFVQTVDFDLELTPDIKLLSRVDHGNLSLVERVNYLTAVIEACDWSWDELYKAYIGKVALNAFRQANGYKEGTYQKLWVSHAEHDPEDLAVTAVIKEEDNYFLEQILTELSLTPGALTYQAVYHKLGIEYMCRTQAN